MNQPASSLPPSFGVCDADIREQLQTFLDEHRKAAYHLLQDLTDDEARLKLVPSDTTLLGLVKHLTLVETIWFTELMTDGVRADFGLPATPAESFLLTDNDTICTVRDAYAEACDRSRSAIESHPLCEMLTGHRLGPMTVQWVLLHCVRETAQHVGHGEILREQILARRR